VIPIVSTSEHFQSKTSAAAPESFERVNVFGFVQSLPFAVTTKAVHFASVAPVGGHRDAITVRRAVRLPSKVSKERVARRVA
jgi:hypothetical protein